ncbi:hypothetical protein CIL05_17660 [Virgibacillus profundi]|uniref:YbbR-like domain-containing protein YbbR n=1 Tax=Virgibacillus profundi TaxID=2024555 RepID=A0A2A2IAV7_9BACI|nr:CdaR family protein [Virgibacillus profundi]PAV28193.1 hypothetical protein CIL05_17660 [Virgibacillus profundi]PXY52498.1 hypothetical protein CIT14_17095 [Virgibacillus profundi]
MDNWFASKWFVRVVSLAFAVSLFAFVYITENSSSQNDSTFPGNTDGFQTLDDVPVDIHIDEENYVVSGVPEFVTVSLEGTAGVVTPLVQLRNFDVYVELEGLEEGQHVVEIKHNISSEINVFIEPKTIEIEIEEKASEAFQVSVDFINENQLAEGYELGEYEVNPTEVTITSSRSVIDKIGIVKVYVDLAGLDRSVNNREIPVNVYDSQGNELNVRVEPETVVVSADINNPSKTVPVSVETTGEMPEGYSLTSISANVDEVEVFATSSVLEGIEGISTEDIDLTEITESGTINVDLAMPDGANVPDMETIEVTVEVEEVEETRTIEAVPIEVEDLEEGQDLSFIEPEASEMDITIAGKPLDISELSADDFRVFINVDGLGSGEHRVPLTIEEPEVEEMEVTGEFEEVTIEIN